MTDPITTRYIFPAPYVIYSRFSDCMIAACFNNGFYHRFTPEASELLELFEKCIVDNHTIRRLKEEYPVTGSKIYEFISYLVSMKIISKEKTTGDIDLPRTTPEQFLRFSDSQKLEPDSRISMIPMLAFRKINIVDKKGWPVERIWIK